MIVVIGSGFAGLSAACTLAKQGRQVVLLEKNSSPGGRARRFKTEGFTFDMGPSWYWMPDVFDSFFASFGKKVSDYYELDRLDPSYAVYFKDGDCVHLPAGMTELEALFEKYEPGSGPKLRQFLKQAAYKYHVGIHDLVQKPSRSLMEFASPQLLLDMLKMDIFSSFRSHARKFFSHPKLLELVEFPVLFLGATAQKTPALYSLMNYADMSLGTWYPRGGMFKIVEGMVSLAEELGVTFKYDSEVSGFEYEGKKVKAVLTTNGQRIEADAVVAAADYHHIDQHVLEKPYRNYSPKYWDSRTMAPSSLIFYLGLNKQIDGLLHHNLFFDEDFNLHSEEIYENPKWPSRPLFYASVVSKTDPDSAPAGHENLFLLVPVAPGLQDSEEMRQKYYDIIMKRLEKHTGQSIANTVVYNRSYAHKDFIGDYHSFKGNAYGLANTLRQTAILKPSLKSKKLDNLYYTGQLTVPGPGVPPSLISGQVVAREIEKEIA